MTGSVGDWSGVRALRGLFMVGSGLHGILALGLSGVGPLDWSTDLDCLRASNLGARGLSCPHFYSSSEYN